MGILRHILSKSHLIRKLVSFLQEFRHCPPSPKFLYYKLCDYSLETECYAIYISINGWSCFFRIRRILNFGTEGKKGWNHFCSAEYLWTVLSASLEFKDKYLDIHCGMYRVRIISLEISDSQHWLDVTLVSF